MALMKKVISVTEIILGIMWEIGSGTVKSFFPHKYAKKFGYGKKINTFQTSLHRLKTKGLVKKTGNIYCLTSKGKKEAFLAFINNEVSMFKLNPQAWDGKWRIIFFDIPEKKRKYRDYLRFIIRTIGFKEFQKSIWIYPHSVPSFLKDLLFEENIKQYTRLITTNEIEYDKDLRAKFSL